MEQPCLLCDEQDPEPKLQKSAKGTKQKDDEDAELIFVGVEHVNEDAELIFVGMTSNSKPVVSNILNRVTPGSCSRRKKYGRLRKNTQSSQPKSHVPFPSETVTVLSESPSESRSTDSPIIIEPLSELDDKNNCSQVVPSSSSDLDSPLVTLTSSSHHPVKTVLSLEDMNESPCVLKRCSTSEVNSINPKSPKLSDGIIGGISSALAASDNSPAVTLEQNISSNDVHSSLSHVQTVAPFPAVFPKVSPHFGPTNINPDVDNGLAKISTLASQNKNCDPKTDRTGSLILLLSDFYYGQHKGNGQPEPKTHSTFKCLSCLKVLKNVKFMNHMKHHFELEKQRGDSWESHTTCQHCYRQFPTPFQLQRHIASVHTAEEPCAVCKICELSFETDQALLQHMKDNHKPGEMPYVCQVCNYRSSAFADVETHFRICHENTKNLLCPFCLKIFKAAAPYVCHSRRHWGKSVNQCSKCRLQFLTFKEKMEHKTRCHRMFKKPEQLEGLPPETKVVIQVSPGPSQPGSVKVASITVSAMESESSPLRSKSKISKKIH